MEKVLSRSAKKLRTSSLSVKDYVGGSVTARLEKRFFGVHLTDPGMDNKVCVFLEKVVSYLQNAGLDHLQGLFRICGSKDEIQYFKSIADKDVFTFSLQDCPDAHIASGLLKQFFRELPEPLIPFDLYPKFVSVGANKTEHRKDLIKDCLKDLPALNNYLLGRLCTFLNEVQKYRESNLMTAENLSTCIGPNLLRSDSIDALSMVGDTAHITSFFASLIEDSSSYFTDLESYQPQFSLTIIEEGGLKELEEELNAIQPKCDSDDGPSVSFSLVNTIPGDGREVKNSGNGSGSGRSVSNRSSPFRSLRKSSAKNIDKPKLNKKYSSCEALNLHDIGPPAPNYVIPAPNLESPPRNSKKEKKPKSEKLARSKSRTSEVDKSEYEKRRRSIVPFPMGENLPY